MMGCVRRVVPPWALRCFGRPSSVHRHHSGERGHRPSVTLRRYLKRDARGFFRPEQTGQSIVRDCTKMQGGTAPGIPMSHIQGHFLIYRSCRPVSVRRYLGCHRRVHLCRITQSCHAIISSAPVEVALLYPHAMQNDGQLPGNGDAGNLIAPSFRDLQAPNAQRRPFL